MVKKIIASFLIILIFNNISILCMDENNLDEAWTWVESLLPESMKEIEDEFEKDNDIQQSMLETPIYIIPGFQGIFECNNDECGENYNTDSLIHNTVNSFQKL